jgi:polar amino acid transport system substrate-binding protein
MKPGFHARISILWSIPLSGLPGAGCDLPRDPEGTLQRAIGGELRVGLSPREPWTRLEGEAAGGFEADLVAEFARELGAKIVYFAGSESELLSALERYELDLVIGGLTQSSPWRDRVGISRPYVVSKLVLAVPPGLPCPSSLSSLEVTVQPGTEAAGLVRRENGVPTSDASPHRPAAGYEWELEPRGFTTCRVLDRQKRVIAAAPGENAFILRLDKFLANRQEKIQERLHESARRAADRDVS